MEFELGLVMVVGSWLRWVWWIRLIKEFRLGLLGDQDLLGKLSLVMGLGSEVFLRERREEEKWGWVEIRGDAFAFFDDLSFGFLLMHLHMT